MRAVREYRAIRQFITDHVALGVISLEHQLAIIHDPVITLVESAQLNSANPATNRLVSLANARAYQKLVTHYPMLQRSLNDAIDRVADGPR